MTPARHHAEWLSLVESSGPFLSLPVLLRAFPQGLDPRDKDRASGLREAYEDWLDRGTRDAAVHTSWIRHILASLLEWPDDYLAEGQAIPAGLESSQPQFGETLRPDLVLRRPEGDTTPQLLVVICPPGQDLDKPVPGKVWKASPATRMMELLHGAGVPLGLLTNGEHWMLVFAQRGETTGFASWYADLWMQEPVTLRAFHSLLHLRRFFGVADTDTLPALFTASAKDQQEVTDQLGYQVRRAVEVLVQAFDALDADSGRTLLAGLPEKQVYDAALTVMMRLVFLFAAEERGLLLLGDPLYDQHYAVSTLSNLLRERADQFGEEVLERRHDAWARLLATFRAVHAGVRHESMRLPAYGGSLFDPDRYPFLEGRASDTRWQETPSSPLPVNNRIVLHLLESLQLLRVKVPGRGPAEARRISFRALDIEQIGHVYEGLLDHTAKRAAEPVLGLAGKKEPEVPLSRLEELAGITPSAVEDEPLAPGAGLKAAESPHDPIVSFPKRKVRYDEEAPAKLIEFLKKETGRTPKALQKDLDALVDDHALLVACGHDPRLARRVRPFAGPLREDDFGQLVVIDSGSLYVTAGTDRRSSGTHFTPRSLTEPVVKHTLEPLVYTGPAEGLPEAQWKLKTPKEILALKVCDMTMGSGAFLVQVCRYLAERLCEAWEIAERDHPGSLVITPDGDLSAGSAAERLLPSDLAERLAIARRYVADRCLYGVDINPMAVEMAKLSLWLITLQKDRPFTFLDHALKCGDSLLGVSSVKQIENFSLRVNPGETLQETFATINLFRYVEAAAAKRRELEDLPSNDHTQIETKTRLHAEAEAATAKVKALAGVLIALELRGLDGNAYEEQRTAEAEKAQLLMKRDAETSFDSQTPATRQLSAYAREQLCGHHPFHWAVEFPEVFARGGFDAFVGNPPFLGGKRISTVWGSEYVGWLKRVVGTTKGAADLCAFFYLRAAGLLREYAGFGLLATNTICQGDTREVALAQIVKAARIIRATQSMSWPGVAGVEVALVHIFRGTWRGDVVLEDRDVTTINSYLTVGEPKPDPKRLSPVLYGTKGTYVHGEGFILHQIAYEAMIKVDQRNAERLRPYLTAQDFTTHYRQEARRWAIWFGDMSEEEAKQYPSLFEHLVINVKPYRDALTKQIHEKCFWKHWDRRDELYAELSKLKHAIVCPEVSKYCCFGLVPTDSLFSSMVNVIASDDVCLFALLQSAFHVEWAWQHGSTMRNDLRYTTSDCFYTFPLPAALPDLHEVGTSYHSHRRATMDSRQEGLTKTYNRFHDRGDQSEDIARLRALHVEMDQAVAAAYGWSELDLGHGFQPTKQGERYTISESARREVLDRLLALNHQRYAEEFAAGLHDKKRKKATRKTASKRGRKPKDAGDTQQELF